MTWIKDQVRKVEKDQHKQDQEEDSRPDCPNCGQSILKQIAHDEMIAINALENILASHSINLQSEYEEEKFNDNDAAKVGSLNNLSQVDLE